MYRLAVHCIAFLLLISLAAANVEKTIFVAPPASEHAATSALAQLTWTLTPEKPWKRTHIPVQFPPSATSTWLYLDQLSPGQRYEVRVCWLATQPTAFQLEAYTQDEIQQSDALKSSLAKFVSSSKVGSQRDEEAAEAEAVSRPTSSLYLRLDAAADYYSLDRSLMDYPEPVKVDLILDPFILNVLPRSLIPVGCYIVVIAVLSWFVAKLAWALLLELAKNDTSSDSKKNL